MFYAVLVTFVIAQAAGVSELVTLFTPLVVFGITEAIKYFLPTIKTKIPGWLIVSFIVPALSILLAWVVPNESLGFLPQVLYGLLAVFIREIISQFKQAGGNS